MIVIDSNERDTVPKQMAALGVGYTRDVIYIDGETCGDYTNTERGWIVERKTAFDYKGSLISKHIYVQLEKMQGFDGPKYLIFEGDFDSLIESETNKGLKALMRVFPLRLAHNYGVHWIECCDALETAETLIMIERYYKGIKEPSIKFEPTISKQTKDNRIRNLLTVPRLGESNAITFLNECKSINNIMYMAKYEPKTLMQIGNKVGPKKVQAIVDMFYGTEPVVMKKKDKAYKIAEKERQQKHAKQRAIYNKGKDKNADNRRGSKGHSG